MIPSGTHNDWIWPLSYIPRQWTAIPSTHPPIQVLGTGRTTDVPDPGNWELLFSRYGFCFVLTTAGKWHFRIGTCRFDYNDGYYQIPTFTIKKLR